MALIFLIYAIYLVVSASLPVFIVFLIAVALMKISKRR